VKNRAIIILLTFYLIISCKNIEKKNNEITKISITTGLCYGTCPIQTVEIDSSLIVKYHGMEFAKRKGYYTGKIKPTDWDSINFRFEKIKYKQLDSVYDYSVDDPPIYLKIYHNNKIKVIRAQSSSLPREVKKTFYWIIDMAKSVKLYKTNDTLNFEKEHLKLMYPIPPTLPPKMKNK
jgi:hypothetical protein